MYSCFIFFLFFFCFFLCFVFFFFNDTATTEIYTLSLHDALPISSFSGMLSSVLGVASFEDSLVAIKKCWASGFGRRSLRYFQKMGLDPEGMAVAVIFQRMVEANSSGVLFTVDPATGDTGVIVLEVAYGYGPGVVSGDITPDLYRIDKESLEISQWDSRPQQHYYDANGVRRQVEAARRSEAKLSEEEICSLVNYGLVAEKSLGAPQDIEWCRGPEGIVLLQARPVTGLEKLSLSRQHPARPEIVMVRGIGVSPRVGWGEVLTVRPEQRDIPPTTEVRGKVILVRSEEHTSELQSHSFISYAVFCLKKKKKYI